MGAAENIHQLWVSESLTVYVIQNFSLLNHVISDLGLLKRDKKLQARYIGWVEEIKKKYGSNTRYLNEYRLQWGKPDTLTLWPSILDLVIDNAPGTVRPDASESSAEVPPYFTADTPARYISIIQNDWPYSVPPEIEHTLIWTKIPIFHPDLIHPSISARIEQDGLWGFTGNTSPPPSPSTLPKCLPALAEWNVTLDQMIMSQKGTDEEEAFVRAAGKEVDTFVRRRWKEEEWETAWFVNPRRLQSVPELAHVHVFARRKI
jgi:hypothetical protein